LVCILKVYYLYILMLSCTWTGYGLDRLTQDEATTELFFLVDVNEN